MRRLCGAGDQEGQGERDGDSVGNSRVASIQAAVVAAALFACLPATASEGGNLPWRADPATDVAFAGDFEDADGLVFRYYAPYGYRFQPLLSFAKLNEAVATHKAAAAHRLAAALVARGVRRGDALYWQYDFPYGGPVPWTSGFAQAVGAQALARTGILVADRSLIRAAEASFRALRKTLLMPLGGGAWVREYGFTHQAILNAQLQSLISLASYAKIVKTAEAGRVVADLEVATLRLLHRFDLGRWSRYELGGSPADLHYHTYHVELLRRLSSTHSEPIWRATYLRWSRSLPVAGAA
jgi:hypothetical protein